MNPEDTELVHRLRTGICPHTGKKYDCAHCEWEKEEPPPLKLGYKRVGTMHMSLCISTWVEQNTPKREWNRLARAFTGAVTGEDVKRYFFTLYSLGVDVIPINEGCDDFCFRHGCSGHYRIEKDCDK